MGVFDRTVMEATVLYVKSKGRVSVLCSVVPGSEVDWAALRLLHFPPLGTLIHGEASDKVVTKVAHSLVTPNDLITLLTC